MKLLYISRLFSGLESSFKNQIWKPNGVPTIFKMIEYLDKYHDVNFIFTVKDSGNDFKSTWKKKHDQEFYIKGLNNKVKILTGINFFSYLGKNKINILIREIRHLIIILYQIYTFKPRIIYIDNSNIFTASILSRLFRKRNIVLRIMGVYPYMKLILKVNSFKNIINKYAYNSKYNLVICTQDGSGVTKWCSNALNKVTEYKILLNGINKINYTNQIDDRIKNIPRDKFNVLYIGKLEEYKGIKEFVKSLLILNTKFPNIFHGVIIGDGNEKKWIKEAINKKKNENLFTHIDNLSHDQIYHAHKKTNLYVSLNKYGNLSNVNLEAIFYGNCIIIPESDNLNEVDLETDEILNKDAVIRIKRNNITKNLSNMIYTLYSNPKLVHQKKKNLKKLSNKIIRSWDDRINDELNIIEERFYKL